MPELPEVETVRRAIERHAAGRVVERVEVRRADVIEGPRSARALLAGGRIARALRMGKRLAVVCEDGRALDVHLGMSGMVLLGANEAALGLSTHVHIVWTLGACAGSPRGERCVMALRDPRRFGGVRTFRSFESLRETMWAPLGPDGASLTTDELAARLARTARPVKSALLDQSVVAGVGNIYADESLFAAGVHPMRTARSVRADEAALLAESVRAVLARAIDAGGSTVRDYARPDGERGWFQLQHAVYDRAGEPCVRCGRALSSGVVGGRTTVWCAMCQPRRGRPGIRGGVRSSAVIHNSPPVGVD